MSRRRILLTTIHASDNFGSVLQATCLVRALSAHGDVDVLDVRPLRSNLGYAQDWLPYQVLRRRVNPEFAEFFGKHRQMRRAWQELPLTGRVRWPRQVDYSGYDAVVVGSDEVWSGLWGNVPPYFVANAPDSVRRVAYAVSAGRSATLGRSSDVPAWVGRFHAVLPRDANTALLCRSVGVEPGPVVCDPVMLTPPNELLSIGAASTVGKASTVLYLEACRRDPRVDEVVRVTGASPELTSVGFPYPGAASRIDARLDDFVASIAGADVVITSMFHGVVTALTLGKTVAVLTHPAKAMKVDDLLGRVGEVVHRADGFVLVQPSGAIEGFRVNSRAALSAAFG